MTIVAHPIVDGQLEAAFEWYEARQAGLGSRLIDEYRDGLVQILQHPHRWQLIDDNIRRYRLRRFPYGIVYSIPDDKGVIAVAAFIHLHSRRSNWRR